MELDQEVARAPEINPLNITNDEKRKENRAADQFFSSLLKHGLLVQRIIVETEEDVERLNQFAARLDERYGIDGGIRNDLLLELALVDYWRYARGLDAETSLFSPKSDSPAFSRSPMSYPGFSASLIRYMTSNRRTLVKTLDLLEEARDKRIYESQSEDLAADEPRVPSRGERRGSRTKKPPGSDSPENRESRPELEASASPQMTGGTKAA